MSQLILFPACYAIKRLEDQIAALENYGDISRQSTIAEMATPVLEGADDRFS